MSCRGRQRPGNGKNKHVLSSKDGGLPPLAIEAWPLNLSQRFDEEGYRDLVQKDRRTVRICMNTRRAADRTSALEAVTRDPHRILSATFTDLVATVHRD